MLRTVYGIGHCNSAFIHAGGIRDDRLIPHLNMLKAPQSLKSLRAATCAIQSVRLTAYTGFDILPRDDPISLKFR